MVRAAMIAATRAAMISSQLSFNQASQRGPVGGGGGGTTGASRTKARKAATRSSGGATGGTRARRRSSIVSSGIALSHQLPQSGECSRLRSPHSVGLHSKDGSYLFGGESRDDPELEHLPIPIGQLGEGVHDLGVLCVEFKRLARALLGAL